jgi:hypothetical protein
MNRILVERSSSTWVVCVGGKRRAVFAGEAARPRAIGFALHLTESLRAHGPVHVVVEPAEPQTTTADERLAS